MGREFSRVERVGSQIQRELASLIREELRDPRLGMVTVQAVRVSRDLAHGKVFFTVLGSDRDAGETRQILNDAAPYLRRLLGRRLSIRSIPQLRFVYDESIERGNRLAALIEQAVDADRDESK